MLKIWTAIGQLADALASLAANLSALAATIHQVDAETRERLGLDADALPEPEANGTPYPEPTRDPAYIPTPSTNRRRRVPLS